MRISERTPLFKAWIVHKYLPNGYLVEYTQQGFFARTVCGDSRFPKFHEFSVRKQKRVIVDYLTSCDAGKKTLKTFYRAWSEYLDFINKNLNLISY